MDEAEESEGAADEEGAQTANAAKLRLTTKKWSSCADKCKGESEITDALKAGKKTPQCCVDLIYETVLYVDRLLTRNKVTYWTMKGTLLGVVREKGVIQHDYDIDIGVLFRDINKIASLRDIIDKDGYVLLQAPWSGYNNMNFVIVKKTKAVRNHFKKNPVKPGKLPKFTKALREKAVSAELMVFEEMNGMLIQVLCTAPHPESPNLYAGKMDRKQMWSEYLQDEKAYQARAASETDGWLKYANGKDLPWVNYHKKFTKNVAPNCERTAPSSFKYEAPAAMVLPPKRLRYFSKTLAVPNDPHAYCTRYFGKDYMTPKRRYGL
jgi:phosphorylcholine metabolism protein LicD